MTRDNRDRRYDFPCLIVQMVVAWTALFITKVGKCSFLWLFLKAWNCHCSTPWTCCKCLQSGSPTKMTRAPDIWCWHIPINLCLLMVCIVHHWIITVDTVCLWCYAVGSLAPPHQDRLNSLLRRSRGSRACPWIHTQSYTHQNFTKMMTNLNVPLIVWTEICRVWIARIQVTTKHGQIIKFFEVVTPHGDVECAWRFLVLFFHGWSVWLRLQMTSRVSRRNGAARTSVSVAWGPGSARL